MSDKSWEPLDLRQRWALIISSWLSCVIAVINITWQTLDGQQKAVGKRGANTDCHGTFTCYKGRNRIGQINACDLSICLSFLLSFHPLYCFLMGSVPRRGMPLEKKLRILSVVGREPSYLQEMCVHLYSSWWKSLLPLFFLSLEHN